MTHDPWLPIGFSFPMGAMAGSVVFSGTCWQIITTSNQGRALLVADELAQVWIAAGLIDPGSFVPVRFGDLHLHTITCGPSDVLAPLTAALSPRNMTDALAFALALKETRRILPAAKLGAALFVEKIARLLPTTEGTETDDGLLLGTWLSGGMAVPATDLEPMQKMVPWLPAERLREVINAAGLEVSSPASPTPVTGVFDLPG